MLAFLQYVVRSTNSWVRPSRQICLWVILVSLEVFILPASGDAKLIMLFSTVLGFSSITSAITPVHLDDSLIVEDMYQRLVQVSTPMATRPYLLEPPPWDQSWRCEALSFNFQILIVFGYLCCRIAAMSLDQFNANPVDRINHISLLLNVYPLHRRYRWFLIGVWVLTTVRVLISYETARFLMPTDNKRISGY